ncbi:hypothetical protein ACFWNQ_24965 [Streptomyces virginiae]|uniref:hypothetical protein n=1 Tax=Streptomyces virginiae TaxID=1961 RepID=UPI00366115C6
MTEQPEPPAPAEQAVCCGCQGAHGPVVYRNYLEQPFCAHCCECSCGTHPCTAPQPEQPGRHTADTITDNDLDQLYAEREKYGQGWLDADRKARVAEAALASEKETSQRLLVQRQEMAVERYAWQERGEQAEQRAERAEAALAQARREQLTDGEAISYWTDAAGLARDHSYWADRARASTILQARRWAARARTAEAAIDRVRELHAKLNDGSCADCCAPDCENNYRDWPCDTIRALNDPKEPTP